MCSVTQISLLFYWPAAVGVDSLYSLKESTRDLNIFGFYFLKLSSTPRLRETSESLDQVFQKAMKENLCV